MTSIRPLLALAVASISALGFATPDSRFAVRVVEAVGLGSGVYGNPAAAVGKPTTWVRDTVNGGPDERVAASIGYPAWNVGPDGSPLLVTVRPGGWLTVEFDPPLRRDPENWHGQDFIVFGNPLVATDTTFRWDTNPSLARVLATGDFLEPSAVSVSPDGLRWYTYPVGPYSAADGYWPTQAFRWDAARRGWGAESDWTRPVPPDLRRERLAGLTVAEAVDLFRGSAGGTAFSLAGTGFPSVRYVRVSGAWGEVDGFARVSRRTAPARALTVPVSPLLP